MSESELKGGGPTLGALRFLVLKDRRQPADAEYMVITRPGQAKLR